MRIFPVTVTCVLYTWTVKSITLALILLMYTRHIYILLTHAKVLKVQQLIVVGCDAVYTPGKEDTQAELQ